MFPERKFPPYFMWDPLTISFSRLILPGCFRSTRLSFPLWNPIQSKTFLEVLLKNTQNSVLPVTLFVLIDLELFLASNSRFEMVLLQKVRQILRRYPLWNSPILWKSASIILNNFFIFFTNTFILLKFKMHFFLDPDDERGSLVRIDKTPLQLIVMVEQDQSERVKIRKNQFFPLFNQF